MAVVHGEPEGESGRMYDLLLRDKVRKMTFVVKEEGKGVQPASLAYKVLRSHNGLSRVRIKLETGRTHQIRVQFSSRGLPLVGERKYSERDDNCEIALWSCRIAFAHLKTGEKMEFTMEPPQVYPWTEC
jgi:23S rRNA pseudouridine1911/1915/1917 synthase